MKDKKKVKEEENSAAEESDSINELKINEEYAKKFKHNKERQLKEKMQAKGKKFVPQEEYSEESDSESQSEDSEGELDNEVIRDKFINTLMKLKDDKESKKLLTDKQPIFTDEDFKEKRKKIHTQEKEEKPKYTINDEMKRNDDDDDDDNDDENNIYSVNYKPKEKVDVNKEEKDAFIKKAKEELDGNESSKEDFFDDGLLKKKAKSSVEVEKKGEAEKKENEPEINLEKMSLPEVLKKSKINSKNVNMDLVNQIWGNDSKLSSTDKFLRNYILSECWLDKDNSDNKRFLIVDKEDEENDDKFDDFENKFNHRFEEEGGANITTYQRNIDSYRRPDDTRALKRKEHDKRKQAETEKIKKEIKEQKTKQGEELKKKLNELEKVAGTDKIAEIYKQFENEDDFDMNEFDKKMNECFDDAYYKKKDDEIEKAEDAEMEDENEEEKYNEDEDIDEDNQDNHLWFYCDNCHVPIKPSKIKYECKTCEDYTLCKECFKTIGHQHQMKKDKVPHDCVIPENAEELINQQVEEEIPKCSKCGKEIISNSYFVCDDENCKGIKICKRCRGEGKSCHEHPVHKIKIEEKEEEEEKLNPKEKLSQLIDNKANSAIDNVIDKGIATKFHYVKVGKEDDDLTNEMLVFLDDKSLNQYVPLKKIAAYSDFKLPKFKRKKMIKHFEKLVERKKREMVEEYEKKMNKEKLEEEDEEQSKKKNKFLNKKHKKSFKSENPGKFLPKAEYKKKKRLETYGIEE